MASEAKLLTLELLKWVAVRPRSQAELREAWGSTCPLTCAWEDAVSDGLLRLEAPAAAGPARVALTARGAALIAAGAISLDPPAHSR